MVFETQITKSYFCEKKLLKITNILLILWNWKIEFHEISKNILANFSKVMANIFGRNIQNFFKTLHLGIKSHKIAQILH